MEKTFLYHEIPAILSGKEYIIYSPFSKKITTIPINKINDEIIYKQLQNNNFFGKINKDIEDGHLTLVVTNNCNLGCKYCYENAGVGKTITFEIAKAGIDNIAQNTKDTIKILFHGGEPTICIDLIKKLHDYITGKYANKKYRMHLITNGIFNQKTFEILQNINIAITISCDGYPEIQDYNRPLKNGEKSSTIVENNIKNLIKANLPVQVMVIITDKTVSKMTRILKYFHNLGVKRIRVEPLISEGRANYCSLIPPKGSTFAKNLFKMIDLAKELGMVITHSSLFHIGHPIYAFCSCGKGNNLTLLPDGRIALCHEINAANEYQLTTRIIGRYNTTSKKTEVDKGKIISFDNKVNISSHKKCSKCFVKRICGGGCPTRNMSENNRLGELNENLCSMRQEIIKEMIMRIYKKSCNQ